MARVTRAAATISLLAALLLVATSAHAALREYRIHFAPSPSPTAAGYSLHIGEDSGNYTVEFDLGNPPESGGTVVYAVDLEDTIDLFVALSAYDASGTASPRSNEIRVSAVEAPPASGSARRVVGATLAPARRVVGATLAPARRVVGATLAPARRVEAISTRVR
jgi:hypothetical protein